MSAQEFNGIKINQPLTKVISLLKSKGFTYKKTTGNTALLEGRLEYDNVVIGLNFNKEKLVYCLAVFIEQKNDWKSINEDFCYYRKLLSDKYYEQILDVQDFTYPFSVDDGFEMLAIKSGKCNYKTYFKDEYGNLIGIAIIDTNQVLITYINKELSNKNKSNNNLK